MQGRDPRDAWAFTQRICGVCTVVHAVASCRAVEDALDITIPPNANLIRNLIHGMQFIQDHVIHFYHLHALDWVDVVSALKADPAGTAAIARKVSPWPNNSETYFRRVQDRLKKFVASGQLGIFTNGYWGHPAYKLPPEVNLLAVAHYLEALDWQRDVIRLHTIFGGKNPHPNFLVGGMACADQPERHRDHQRGAADRHPRHDHPGPGSSWSRCTGPTSWPSRASTRTGRRWAAGCKNYLAVGEFPDGDVRETEKLYFPRGIVLERDLTRVWPYDQNQVKEYITSSWYEYSKGDDAGLHPYEGETKPKYAGPPTPWKYLQDSPKYTWMKAPRYDGKPDGGRPAGAGAGGIRLRPRGDPGDGQGGARPARGGPAALFSTLGRVAARGMETVLLARRMNVWYDRLVERIRSGDTKTFDGDKWEPGPVAGQGAGLRLPRCAPRRPGPLGPDRERQDLPLPVRGAQHLELLAPRRPGPDGALRSRAGGQPSAAQAGPAAGDPADDPLVRSLHGLRRPRAGRDREP